MGRKDAKRFIAIEKRIKALKTDQEGLLRVQEKTVRNWKFSLSLIREIIDKLIDRE
jgi:hypothetical protein